MSVQVYRKDGTSKQSSLNEQAQNLFHSSLAVMSNRRIESGPVDSRIHGCRAVRYHVTGFFGEHAVACLFTVVETESAFE